MSRPTLHLLSGKAASGKSTLAGKLSNQPKTILLSEDTWLAALYADQLITLKDYVRCSANLRTVIGPHVSALLSAGLSVVLDFPANTIETRRWMRTILDETDAAHCLHLIDPPDATCLARLQARNASGQHPFSVTEEQFQRLAKHFQPPMPEEGFHIQRYDEVI